jgi:hypothetical protein
MISRFWSIANGKGLLLANRPRILLISCTKGVALALSIVAFAPLFFLISGGFCLDELDRIPNPARSGAKRVAALIGVPVGVPRSCGGVDKGLEAMSVIFLFVASAFPSNVLGLDGGVESN